MTNALQPAPEAMKGSITVPRVALQALADFARPDFAYARISAKHPANHPRWTSWNIHDDLQVELERERLVFLKEVFWKAYREAGARDLPEGSHLAYDTPSLETFMTCLAEMEDPHRDEPLTPKEVKERKKKIRAKNAEREAAQEWMAKLEHEREHPTPESAAKTMTHFREIALFTIKEHLASEDPEIQAKAQAEIQHLKAGLDKLLDGSRAVA